MTKTFRSKVDGWYYGVLATIPLLALTPPLLAPDTISFGLTVAIAIIAPALPVWLLVSTTYTIDETTLLIRSGPFRWQIPIDSIQTVEPSRSPMSSPALSLDRLKIRYGRWQTVLVSPQDPGAFLEALGIQT